MKELRGSNALLTGAAGGIGGHIARRLADEGVHLVLSGRNTAVLEALRDELRAKGATAEVVTADLADPDQVPVLVERSEAALGPIDILVNNAGIELTSSFTAQTVEELKLYTDVNLLAPMLLTHRVLPGMLRRGRGHVVQISSIGGKFGPPYGSPYGATKAGLVGLTQALRTEYSDAPVGFSVICPGFVNDDGMYARMVADGIKAPAAVGATKPRKVTDAVVRAIRDDVPEIVVNQTPMRPMLMLAALSPRTAERLLLRMGVKDVFARAAELRGRLQEPGVLDEAGGQPAVARQPAAPGGEHADGNGRPEPVHAGEHGDDARQAGERGPDEGGAGG
jgi:short-subunit dehydrogenase